VDKNTLTVTDNRTGKAYELPISDGTIRAMDLRQIKVSDDDFGLMTYDPAFMNTASCKSRITFIDGDKGILRYRGYPIEQLAEHSTYAEVAYLLLQGERKKFAMGASTILNVIQVQRDLSAAQLVEVAALNAYSRSQTQLELATGEILSDHHVIMDEVGGVPVVATY